jgi:hypothetical protein
MKEADSVFSSFLLIAVILASIIVLIGMYPYIMRLLKALYIVYDSVSDFYHHSIKPKQTIMAKKTNPKEFNINPDDIKIDRSELEVTLPEVALSNQFKVIAVNQMHADMIEDINRKRPVTLWGQERFINKLRNQNMRIELTIDQIGLHNKFIREAAKLEATMLHTPQLVEHELEMMLLDEKFEKERKIHLFMDELHELEGKRKHRDMDIKIKDAEHDRYVMETKLSEIERKAKINYVLATTDQEKARAALMDASLELFENGELSEKLQAYLIISVFNPGEQSYVDLNMDEDLADILKKEKKYDANKKKWEAKSMKTDLEHKKAKFERQRNQQKENE